MQLAVILTDSEHCQSVDVVLNQTIPLISSHYVDNLSTFVNVLNQNCTLKAGNRWIVR